MHIHEYQAKRLLAKYGIRVPEFYIISQEKGAEEIVNGLPFDSAVVKIQVHAGGRGKGGGVKIAHGKAQILKYARELLGFRLVNPQTGQEGLISREVLLTPLVNIKQEYYIGVVIDRPQAQAVLLASPEGGMEIEEVAQQSPEKILRILLGSKGVLPKEALLKLADFMGWKGNIRQQGIQLAENLAKAFYETDASLIEINPLVETPSGELLAVDAKLAVDDNALFRQSEIAGFYDPSQLSPLEAEAHAHDLAYVALDGNIGCMVNGAGLAMATMDLIHYHGGEPANFLDVGGGATKEKVAEGFKILLSDQKVRAILVNIFGGIMNCATIAEGILAAVRELQLSVPLVVRMEGTNVEEGRRLILESGLDIFLANNLTDAAEQAVAAVR